MIVFLGVEVVARGEAPAEVGEDKELVDAAEEWVEAQEIDLVQDPVEIVYARVVANV